MSVGGKCEGKGLKRWRRGSGEREAADGGTDERVRRRKVSGSGGAHFLERPHSRTGSK